MRATLIHYELEEVYELSKLKPNAKAKDYEAVIEIPKKKYEEFLEIERKWSDMQMYFRWLAKEAQKKPQKVMKDRTRIYKEVPATL